MDDRTRFVIEVQVTDPDKLEHTKSILRQRLLESTKFLPHLREAIVVNLDEFSFLK